MFCSAHHRGDAWWGRRDPVGTGLGNPVPDSDCQPTIVRYHLRAVPFSEADTRAKLIDPAPKDFQALTQ